MNIISVVGTRPQFIKCAPLIRELGKIHRNILIHTGQHYDYYMNKVFFDELEIPSPDYNLEVGSGTHAYQVGEMLKGIAKILADEKPDLVIIYGDTNSALAGALAAAQLHIKAAHVEAGLRGFDKFNIEEINRAVADRYSDYLFCPTQTAIDNLRMENIINGVYLTGDVMADALAFNKGRAEHSHILEDLCLKTKQYSVVTVHRARSTEIRQNLVNITHALITLGQMGEILVFPVHPRTEKLLKAEKLFDRLKQSVKVTGPLGYLEFLKLMNHARKIITDSGGTQKEAYMLKVPCITLRENTEWIETVKDGWNKLVGTDAASIIQSVLGFKSNHHYSDFFQPGACKKICKLLS